MKYQAFTDGKKNRISIKLKKCVVFSMCLVLPDLSKKLS